MRGSGTVRVANLVLSLLIVLVVCAAVTSGDETDPAGVPVVITQTFTQPASRTSKNLKQVQGQWSGSLLAVPQVGGKAEWHADWAPVMITDVIVGRARVQLRAEPGFVTYENRRTMEDLGWSFH